MRQLLLEFLDKKSLDLSDLKPDYPALTGILYTFLVVIVNFVILEW